MGGADAAVTWLPPQPRWIASFLPSSISGPTFPQRARQARRWPTRQWHGPGSTWNGSEQLSRPVDRDLLGCGVGGLTVGSFD